MKHRALSIALGVFVLCAAPAAVLAGDSVQYIRKNAASPDAIADLQALETALEKMRALDCNDPRSWYYQGATHAVPSAIADGQNPLCPSYRQLADLKWGWNTCPHDKDHVSDIHFLVWHRLYVHHFEAIVRELSGKKDFALPYWDYTNPGLRVMPGALTRVGSSLFTDERLPSLNQGKPIVNTPDYDMDQMLDISKLFESRVFSAFNNQINAAPHGVMHDYIGGGANDLLMWNSIYRDKSHSGLMSHVPSAGFDPVFWLHHANIDYLWQKWERSPNGQRPTLDELKKVPWKYQFFAADGSKVEYTIEQAYNAAFNLDYAYDQLGSSVAALHSQDGQALLTGTAQQQPRQLWQVSPQKVLEGAHIELDVPASAVEDVPQLGAGATSALVLEMNVTFSEAPDHAYTVLIRDADGKESVAGYMSFFGADHHMQSDGHDGHSHERLSAKFLFDVSDELPADGKYTIRVQSHGKHGDALRIDSMSLHRY